MTSLTISMPCSSCGTRFRPTEHQVRSSLVINCPACKLCLACGGPRPAGPKPYKLRICKLCTTVAWQSCWRKQAHAQQPEHVVHEDGVELNAYRCELCGWWHLTKIAADADLGSDYNSRRSGLASLFTRISFDIDAFRFRTPTH